jgi:hypothetical protein
MKFSLTFFILLGILVLIYLIILENEKSKKMNSIDNQKKDVKKKHKNNILSKDSLIEQYNDTESENKINYDIESENHSNNYDKSSSESIFNNYENFDNLYSTYIKSSKFTGKKDGYIFRNGKEGIGYYIDEFVKKLDENNIYIDHDDHKFS